MKAVRPAKLPGDYVESGWSAVLGDWAASPLQGDHTADWVVVGAGFTGLACARRLAELNPDDRILLIDALPLGQGASGRNSGFVSESVPPEGGIKGLNLDLAIRKSKLMRAGTELLRGLTKKHEIDCDWSDEARVKASTNPEGESYLGKIQQGFTAVGTKVERLSREQVQDHLGCEFYGPGIAIHGGALVQPAALLRGLARSLPPNVTLADGSPVIEISMDSPFKLALPGGTVTSEKVMLCCNIFLSQFGYARGRYMYLVTHASLTEPMTDQHAASFPSQKTFGLVPAIHGAATVRRTADNRILMRKTTGYATKDLRVDPATLPGVKRGHRKSIDDRWPALADLPIAHTWGGIVSYPANHGQVFGELRPNLFASSSCCGIGITLGTISGSLLAEKASGHSSDLLNTVESVPGPIRMPPEPLRRYIALKALRKSTKACQPD